MDSNLTKVCPQCTSRAVCKCGYAFPSKRKAQSGNAIPTNPQTNFCLSFVEKLLDMGTFLLENAACLSKMYGHYISQVLTKMWELVLDIKQKAGWLVGNETQESAQGECESL